MEREKDEAYIQESQKRDGFKDEQYFIIPTESFKEYLIRYSLNDSVGIMKYCSSLNPSLFWLSCMYASSFSLSIFVCPLAFYEFLITLFMVLFHYIQHSNFMEYCPSFYEI